MTTAGVKGTLRASFASYASDYAESMLTRLLDSIKPFKASRFVNLTFDEGAIIKLCFLPELTFEVEMSKLVGSLSFAAV